MKKLKIAIKMTCLTIAVPFLFPYYFFTGNKKLLLFLNSRHSK